MPGDRRRPKTILCSTTCAWVGAGWCRSDMDIPEVTGAGAHHRPRCRSGARRPRTFSFPPAWLFAFNPLLLFYQIRNLNSWVAGTFSHSRSLTGRTTTSRPFTKLHSSSSSSQAHISSLFFFPLEHQPEISLASTPHFNSWNKSSRSHCLA